MGKVKQMQQDVLAAAEPGPGQSGLPAFRRARKKRLAAQASAKRHRSVMLLATLLLLLVLLTACDQAAYNLECLDGCDSTSPHYTYVQQPVACELPDTCYIVAENKHKRIVHCEKP